MISHLKKLRCRHHVICETIQIDFYGKKDSVPEILQGGLLVQSPVKGLAKEMKVSRDKLRLKGGFDVKKRKKTHLDDSEIVSQVQNYFELDENSSQGDRTRNVKVIDGIEIQRRYLRHPVDVIARNFFEKMGVPFPGVKTNIAKNFLLKSYQL